MTNEVTVTTLLGNQGDPVEYTIAVGTLGTNIAKGTIMKIGSSPQTVAAASADGDHVAGVLAAEHAGGTGVTKVSVLTHFVGETYSTTGMTLGYPMKVEGANAVTDADDDTIAHKGEACCISLETNAGTAASACLWNLG